MKKWWTHYESYLPKTNDIEKQQIEDITGCTPLFLRALLGLDRNRDVLSGLLNSQDLRNVVDQVEKFVLDEKEKENSLTWPLQV